MSDAPKPKQIQKEFTCRNCGQIFTLNKQNAAVLTYTNPRHVRFTTLVVGCNHCRSCTNVFAPPEALEDLISSGCIRLIERESADEAVIAAYCKSLGTQPSKQGNLSSYNEKMVRFFRWQLENNFEELQQWT